tara:strand:- start:506 stop:2164 length:1659 start_codon:yes stop_codon:yes gene_type:complete
MPTRAEQLQSLSDDELMKLMQPIFAQQAQGGSQGETSIIDFLQQPEVEPTGQEGLLAGLSNAAQNLPFSVAERGREFEQLARHPLDTLSGLGQLLKGGLDVGAEKFGAEPTEAGKMARKAGGQLMEDFTSKGLQRDPTAALSTLASVVAPGLKAGGLTKAAGVANIAADLPATAIRGLGALTKPARSGARKAAGAIAGGVGDITAEVLGRTTGSRAPAIREAFNAGREGVEQSGAFKQAVSDNITKKDIGRQTIDALQEERSRLGDEVGGAVDTLGDTPLNVDDLLDQIDETLQGFGIKNFTFPADFDKAAQGKIIGAIERIMDLGDETSIKPATQARRGIDQITESVGLDDRRMKKLLGELNSGLRESINSVEDVGKANAAFSEFGSFLDDIVEGDLGININRKKKRKQAGVKVVRALDEGREDELAALGAVEGRTGQNLRAQAAGQRLSTTPPVGLLGSVGIGGIAGGLAVGGGVLGGLSGAALAIPLAALFSPRAVGRIAVHFGNNTRRAQAVIDEARKLSQSMPQIELQNISTLGELVQRATNQQDER